MEALLSAEQDPAKFIADHPDGVIINEAHHFPKIFSYIQVAVDDDADTLILNVAIPASGAGDYPGRNYSGITIQPISSGT